jgi:chemotaxis protein histidine kinase CheA
MASFDDMAFDERTFVSDLTDNSQEEKHRMAFSQKLSKFGVDELKEKCRENNIQGYLKCKKAELIDLISLEYDKNIRLLKLLKANDLKNLCKSNKLRCTALKRPEMIDIIIEFNASCMATKFVSAADCADVGSDEEKPKKPTVDEKEPKLSDAEQRIKNLQQIIEDIKKEKEPVEITKEEPKKVKKTEEGEKVKKPKKEKEEKEEKKEEKEKEKEKERIEAEEEKERIRLAEEAESEEKEKEKLEKEKEKAKKTKQPKETIPKQIKSIVWNQYIGEDVRKHKCLCCKKVSIENTNFHAGHVISEKNGGTLEIGNLRPICPSCNYSMGTENMVEFVKKYGLYIG